MRDIIAYINNECDYYAFKLTRDSYLARDLIQDTCLAFLRKGEAYKDLPLKEQKMLCHTIMRNIFIDQYRRSKKLSIVTDDFSSLKKIEKDVSHNIEAKRVFDFVSTSKHRGIKYFYLYYSGYRYEDIANEFGENLNTVKGRIRMGKQKIIKDLQL